jgi:hypothetical protein
VAEGTEADVLCQNSDVAISVPVTSKNSQRRGRETHFARTKTVNSLRRKAGPVLDSTLVFGQSTYSTCNGSNAAKFPRSPGLTKAGLLKQNSSLPRAFKGKIPRWRTVENLCNPKKTQFKPGNLLLL